MPLQQLSITLNSHEGTPDACQVMHTPEQSRLTSSVSLPSRSESASPISEPDAEELDSIVLRGRPCLLLSLGLLMADGESFLFFPVCVDSCNCLAASAAAAVSSAEGLRSADSWT